MRKIFNYFLALIIFLAIVASLFFLMYFISNDKDVTDSFESVECLDKKETVIIVEKEIESDFLWSKTYILVAENIDGERFVFTVSSEAYYSIEINEKAYYCERCDQIFIP